MSRNQPPAGKFAKGEQAWRGERATYANPKQTQGAAPNLETHPFRILPALMVGITMSVCALR